MQPAGAAALGARVECRLVDTSERETMLAWGESDALFVDDRRVWTGPQPSEAKLARIIRRRLRHRIDPSGSSPADPGRGG